MKKKIFSLRSFHERFFVFNKVFFRFYHVLFLFSVIFSTYYTCFVRFWLLFYRRNIIKAIVAEKINIRSLEFEALSFASSRGLERFLCPRSCPDEKNFFSSPKIGTKTEISVPHQQIILSMYWAQLLYHMFITNNQGRVLRGWFFEK